MAACSSSGARAPPTRPDPRRLRTRALKSCEKTYTPMIKSELVLKIAEQNPHLYQRDVETLVNAILDTIADALARGDRVELRGFGAFSVKRRDARRGRNPRTGAAVAVSEKAIPVFKTGKEMRLRLNAAGIGESQSAAE